MRHVRLRRALSTLAILIGLLGGLTVAGYALLGLIGDALSSPACRGGGCESALSADDAHFEDLMELAALGSGVLIAIGIVEKRAIAKHIRASTPPAPAALPAATVVDRRDS